MPMEKYCKWNGNNQRHVQRIGSNAAIPEPINTWATLTGNWNEKNIKFPSRCQSQATNSSYSSSSASYEFSSFTHNVPTICQCERMAFFVVVRAILDSIPSWHWRNEKNNKNTHDQSKCRLNPGDFLLLLLLLLFFLLQPRTSKWRLNKNVRGSCARQWSCAIVVSRWLLCTHPTSPVRRILVKPKEAIPQWMPIRTDWHMMIRKQGATGRLRSTLIYSVLRNELRDTDPRRISKDKLPTLQPPSRNRTDGRKYTFGLSSVS